MRLRSIGAKVLVKVNLEVNVKAKTNVKVKVQVKAKRGIGIVIVCSFVERVRIGSELSDKLLVYVGSDWA